MAESGEFTRCAFLNDKIDLVQAETVVDLIKANTEATACPVTRSLGGMSSQMVHALVERVIHLRMLVGVMLDFPGGKIDFLEVSDVCGQFASIRAAVDGVPT